jgi:hypothetical protein
MIEKKGDFSFALRFESNAGIAGGSHFKVLGHGQLNTTRFDI